jgi:two-component SAPR family response regulator
MIRILLASADTKRVNTIMSLIKKQNDTQLTQSESGMKALSEVKNEIFDLAIIDEKLKDMSGLELAKKMVLENPLVNCAAISGASSEKFHEDTEGLGLLMQLPLCPNEIHIENLLSQLKKIRNIASTTKDGGT